MRAPEISTPGYSIEDKSLARSWKGKTEEKIVSIANDVSFETSLINKNVGEAVLIWREHEGRAGWELGLEFQGRARDFWSIDF